MMKAVTQVVLAILVTGVVGASEIGNSGSAKAAANVAFGLGVGGAANGMQGAMGMVVTIKGGKLVYSFRLLGASEINILGGPSDGEIEAAFLLGTSSMDAYGASAAFQIGLGVAQIDHPKQVTVESGGYGGYETPYTVEKTLRSSKSAAGLALQGQLYASRVGLVIFGNVNTVASFGGAMLCVRIGQKM